MAPLTSSGSGVRLMGLVFCGFVACACAREESTARVNAPPPPAASQPVVAAASAAPQGKYTKPSDDELKRKLTPLAYRVTQEAATEPPFQNAYWDNHEEGIYVDAVTGEPLFSSKDKFESGTGWPSFTRPIDSSKLVSSADESVGMERTEVRSSSGNSHLGHVFDDGPGPDGKRFCINSASLRFVPVKDLAKEGYGQYTAMFTR